jgi:hypothetical protein
MLVAIYVNNRQYTEAVYLRAHHVSLLNLTSRVCACNGMLFQSPTRGLRGKIVHGIMRALC